MTNESIVAGAAPDLVDAFCHPIDFHFGNSYPRLRLDPEVKRPAGKKP
jgi:hypothetical protein